jgi:cell division transport system permease protein
MIPVPYAFRLAAQSLLREKWINLLSILTIASGLLIISISLFVVYNIDAATKKLPEKFSVVLYLDDGIERDSVINSLKKNPAIATVKFISKDEAMREMRGLLKDSGYVFEGLDENPLPDSLEIKLKKEAFSPDAVKKIADEALKIKGVHAVEYGEKFLSTLHHLKVGFKTIGMILIGLLSTGIIFVCYSTVKILFYRKNDEVETFKLLGATKAFIRIPFLIEGAFIGTAGGLLSLLGIAVFYYVVLLKLSLTMPLLKVILFPSDLFLPLPFIGMFLGITGAAVALGRLRY